MKERTAESTLVAPGFIRAQLIATEATQDLHDGKVADSWEKLALQNLQDLFPSSELATQFQLRALQSLINKNLSEKRQLLERMLRLVIAQ
eukprot:CAMPEP_0206623496 /NCGR_PEP_ID=MMETSP0325_2-20121206/63509_1 /ASSEMBLY_ACC=CAM_ASM_000347 /TAXON_ID=2866 /ORGANISM="Crypthecodinium cohnii, Strain Seligo" /LENGTH=89 /DNA_ID=CAMNT_0054147169 /DNA_START=15 /DNA_END=281 /DNA_ORIENTATION=-